MDNIPGATMMREDEIRKQKNSSLEEQVSNARTSPHVTLDMCTIELQREIINYLDFNSAKRLRLVCKRLDEVASERVLYTVLIDRNSLEKTHEAIWHLSSVKYRRHLVYEPSDHDNYKQWVLREDSNVPHALSKAVAFFSHLSSLTVFIDPQNDIAAPEYFPNRDIVRFLKDMILHGEDGCGRNLFDKKTPFRTLELCNHGDEDIIIDDADRPLFSKLFGRLEKLRILVDPELNLAASGWTSSVHRSYFTMWESLRKTWVEPVQNTLTELTLCTTFSSYGYYTEMRLDAMEFPQLRRLVLGGYAIHSPGQINWLCSLSKLEVLCLFRCPIVRRAVAWKFHADRRPDSSGGRPNYKLTERKTLTNNLTWASIFADFKTGMPFLRRFVYHTYTWTRKEYEERLVQSFFDDPYAEEWDDNSILHQSAYGMYEHTQKGHIHRDFEEAWPLDNRVTRAIADTKAFEVLQKQVCRNQKEFEENEWKRIERVGF